MSASRFDEGYSEDTRSQNGSDMAMRTDSRQDDAGMEFDASTLPDWVKALSESDRSEFAYAILRSLRTSSIAGIVEKLNPLLHLDPVLHLPPEITFQILSYLDPETLLRASILSKSWRLRVLDGPLWKLLFRLEGWNSNFPQVHAYEDTEKQRRIEHRERERKTRPRAAEDTDRDKQPSKKRAREPRLFGDGPSNQNSIHDEMKPLSLNSSSQSHTPWGEQHGLVEADEGSFGKAEDQMEGVSFCNSSPVSTRGRTNTQSELASPTSAVATIIKPALLLPGPEPKVNWQFLYKQKRRLEENWEAGRFSNFQLPHPNYPDEAHTECVYTIQYSGNFLVSGSRDKTVRIWNLETLRLVHPPLAGHSASVLCLQFDDRPGQDLVVSGGSDCRVILWRFSTGRIIREIEKAHSESVLNLRFDDRFLVTCSKDKTIKVWNRKEMCPTDDIYPLSTKKSESSTGNGNRATFPSYIINMTEQLINQHLHFKPLQPYSLVMTLEGHSAAVNAIQILDGNIVSASGDRTVRIWDVRTGACTRTFHGHSKGIACVQFDGRRIVSGSSDETVRIFDRVTGAEVACLQGHANLVRTVQAQFGDLPGNEEELEAEARAVDRDFFEAQSKGLLPKRLNRAQRRARNAGSRDPGSIFAIGAKLPPGGGGSKWARIVSGSYDETVIIWKKGTDGSWEKSKTLFQSQAVRAAGGQPRRPVVPANPAHNNPQQQAAPVAPQQNGFQALAQQAQAQQAQVQAQAAQTLASETQALHVATQIMNGLAPQSGGPANPAAPAQPGAAQQPNAPPHHHHHHPPPPHHHHPHPPHPPNPANALNTAGTNSRVFKLQFDARRIICCSQDPTIVGWDFANGDRNIVSASQFFGDSY